MKVLYKKLKDDSIQVTFENKKCLLFTDTWTIADLKYLAKYSKTIAYLFDRTANLGSLNNTSVPSTEDQQVQRHFFYLAVRNTMLAMTRHGYSLDDLIKLETIIFTTASISADYVKTTLAEYLLEKDIREELADVIRYHNYK